MEPITLSIADTCKVLGIGRTTAWRLVNAGDLLTIRIGSRRLVTAESVKRFVERSAA